MDINHIECFLNVAKTLNFSEAARRSYISQSMVSRYIAKLEQEFGARLFVRTKKEVKLTAEGKAFLPYAAVIADNMKRAKFAVDQLKGGYEGRLKIVCDLASGTFAARCISDFIKQYPNIAVDITELHGEDLKINDESADFAFLLRDMLPEGGTMDYIITYEDTLSVISKKEIKSLAFDKESFVILSETENPILYMEVMDIFHSKRVMPKIVSRPNGIDSVLIAVEAGMGSTVLPTSIAENTNYDNLNTSEIKDIDTSLIYAAAWNGKSTNPAVGLFLEVVKKYAEDLEYEY